MTAHMYVLGPAKIEEVANTRCRTATFIGGDESQKTGEMLAEMISENAHLRELTLDGLRMNPQVFAHVMEAVGRNGHIRKFTVTRCPLPEGGDAAMEKLLRTSKTLVEVGLLDKPQFDPLVERLERAAMESGNHNLLRFDNYTPGREMETYLLQNQERVRGLFDTVAKTSDGEIGVGLLHDLHFLRPAVEVAEEGPVKARILSLQSALPGMPPQGADFWEALYTPVAGGFAPLDNPGMVKSAREAHSLLDEALAQGVPLDRETERGGTLLNVLAQAMPTGKLLGALNAADEQLGADRLLEGRTRPNALFRTLMRKGEVAALFGEANCHGQQPGAVNRMCHALPPEQRKFTYRSFSGMQATRSL